MAEHTVICLDVGSSMCKSQGDGRPTHLETAVKAINVMVQNKILFSKKALIGLVLFGTEDTLNDLAGDGQYQHVSVIQPLVSPDVDLLRFIENSITPGGRDGDFLDGLVVSMDVLIKGSADAKKCDKRIILFTDAGSKVNEDGLDGIVDGLLGHEITVQVVGIGQDEEEEEGVEKKYAPSAAVLANLTEKVSGHVFSFESALTLVSKFRKRQINPTTVFRGCLEIADLKIPVHAYSRERREPVPTFTKLSGLVAIDPKNPESGKVTRDVTYHKMDEDSTEVGKDALIKGFKFGKDFVPFSKVDESNMGLKTEKCMKVLCFTSMDNIPRHHYMGGALISLTHPPGDDTAAVSISALAHALFNTNSVAIVRYVFRAKANPKIGMVFPHIKPDYEALFYVSLPFREDVRPYQFPSFAKNPKAQTTPEQREAMAKFINKMDLMQAFQEEDGRRSEALQPKLTFNPVIQYIHQCLHHRALNPHDPLPALDPMIASYLNPCAELVKESEREIQGLRDLFPLVKKETNKGTKTATSIWGAGAEAEEDAAGPSKRPRMEADADLSMSALMRTEVTSVGSINPVSDYLAILARKTEDLLVTASNQLMQRIDDLVDFYVGGPTTPFAEMVTVLRRELLHDEPKLFNDYLVRLRDNILKHIAQNQPFLDQLLQHKITLISSDESPESSVSAAEAAAFLTPAAAPSASLPVAAADEDEAALLDDL